MSATKEYIGNLQRRIANQRTEIEALHSIIKRQHAEIEALRQRLAENENGYAQTVYLLRLEKKDLAAEVERLNKEVDRLSQVVLYNDGITEMKVCEAITNFAERLKPRVDCEYGNKFYRDKCFEEIDNLVKEMTGEQI